MDKLRFDNPREELANNLVKNNKYTLNTVEVRNPDAFGKEVEGGTKLSGTVTSEGRKQETSLVIDNDDRIRQANCSCHFYIQNRLRMGPCEHILTLKIAHSQRSVWYKKMFQN